jgi:hypothetical protein
LLPNHWLPGINLCAQFPLFDVYPPFPLLDGNLCIAGDYIFCFAVDNNADGLLDATWLDYVEVHVEGYFKRRPIYRDPHCGRKPDLGVPTMLIQ